MSKPMAIVAAKFNSDVVEPLVAGALAVLEAAGVRFDLHRVPGAFELPLVCQRLAESGQYAAVIALGAVIRGDTDHYDYVCQAATHGLLRVGLDSGLPVIFGVLTCDTDEQAMARAGGAEGNKGADAAQAALEMVEVMNRLPGRG